MEAYFHVLYACNEYSIPIIAKLSLQPHWAAEIPRIRYRIAPVSGSLSDSIQGKIVNVKLHKTGDISHKAGDHKARGMSLGRALRELRTINKMTLAQLARQSGSHVGNLSRIERDETRPSLELLYRIAAALGYRLSDIFSLADLHKIEKDTRQAALNTVFVSLLERDKKLLLEFARVMHETEREKLSGDARNILPPGADDRSIPEKQSAGSSGTPSV